jgi:hypothetical protein
MEKIIFFDKNNITLNDCKNNIHIIDLLNHTDDYIYCSLCDRSIKKYNREIHDKCNKHQNYYYDNNNLA